MLNSNAWSPCNSPHERWTVYPMEKDNPSRITCSVWCYRLVLHSLIERKLYVPFALHTYECVFLLFWIFYLCEKRKENSLLLWYGMLNMTTLLPLFKSTFTTPSYFTFNYSYHTKFSIRQDFQICFLLKY